jgi:mannose-6-phosphate isomerase-like protein (cupin superfamily)
MQTTNSSIKATSAFQPDIDQMESLGTQIQWADAENAEAGTVLLAAETDGPPIHFHPIQEETFFIQKGELQVFKQDKWITLKAGESLTIPAKTPHSYKNTSSKNVLFDFYITPQVRFKQMLERMDVYVQQGKIKGTDFKSVTYLCRVMAEFPDVTQCVQPPQFVVQIMAFINKVFFK